MPIAAIHPGEQLAEELQELGMSASELARNLQVPPNRITAILNGQRSITGDTALRLAHFFGTSAQFWLNSQASTICASPSKVPERGSGNFRSLLRRRPIRRDGFFQPPRISHSYMALEAQASTVAGACA